MIHPVSYDLKFNFLEFMGGLRRKGQGSRPFGRGIDIEEFICVEGENSKSFKIKKGNEEIGELEYQSLAPRG